MTNTKPTWEDEWIELCKINFDGFSGNSHAVSHKELKWRMFGLDFIRKVEEEAYERGREEGQRDLLINPMKNFF